MITVPVELTMNASSVFACVRRSLVSEIGLVDWVCGVEEWFVNDGVSRDCGCFKRNSCIAIVHVRCLLF
jgi:hypothetical protein